MKFWTEHFAWSPEDIALTMYDWHLQHMLR